MGKRCDCGWVMEMFERDPRLAALPLAVRALWLVLVRRMQALGGAALVFNGHVPEPREVAMLVPMAETDLETQLAPLLARGLLVRREDGALACPMLEAQAAARARRAETARINGLKGGRPRKDGQPPAQRTMPLPIPGGRAGGPAETQEKPTDAAMGFPAKPELSLAEEKAKPSLAARAEEAHRIGLLAAEAAQVDPVRGGWTTGVVGQWLDAGADEALILGAIREVMARPNPPRELRGLGYFTRCILERVAERRAAPAEVPAAGWAEPAEAYVARFDAWQAAGCIGTPPQRRRAA